MMVCFLFCLLGCVGLGCVWLCWGVLCWVALELVGLGWLVLCSLGICLAVLGEFRSVCVVLGCVAPGCVGFFSGVLGCAVLGRDCWVCWVGTGWLVLGCVCSL